MEMEEIKNVNELFLQQLMWFAELPLDSCVGQLQRIRHIPPYSFCAMCGSKELLYNYSITPCSYGRITLFCNRRSRCFKKYGQCLGGLSNTDLTNGVPNLWKRMRNDEKLFCQIPRREKNSKGELFELTCSYCGIKSTEVVSHPRVPKQYGFTSFCKNAVCYSSFTHYMDNVAKVCVPYALSRDCKWWGDEDSKSSSKSSSKGNCRRSDDSSLLITKSKASDSFSSAGGGNGLARNKKSPKMRSGEL